MYMFLGFFCWGVYCLFGHVTAWIIAGAICILAEGISDLAAEMKARGKDHDATIKKCVENHDATIKRCVEDYRGTLKMINAKNTLNAVYGVGGINGFSVTPTSGVSESVDSPDVDRL